MDEFIQENYTKGVAIGLTEKETHAFLHWYGTNAPYIFSLADELKKEELPLNIELALLYALKYEGVITPVDFFLRRTDLLLFSSETIKKLKAPVIRYMENYFKWTEEEKEKWETQLEKTISGVQLKNLRSQ